ncbi:MAG: methyltransferase domain-containing protein [Lewinellaceae bacterium]|nr:methyltransferase domain-containing protein [Lewinellaceae bacterium]
MNVQQSYDSWSSQYDTNKNKTRDLEALSLRTTLLNIPFDSCLEIGCGTGKNTEWLVTKAGHITAVDLSEGMLAIARSKVSSDKVQFRQADITQPWTFADRPYDLISFSLVLEHIENLDHIFSEACKVIAPGGHLYIGELHPFKQYSGTKARFDTKEGQQVVTCFDHHVSDFIQTAQACGFELVLLNELFDDHDRTGIPRILTLLLKKGDIG